MVQALRPMKVQSRDDNREREAHRRDSGRLLQGTWRGTGRAPLGWIALNLEVRDLYLPKLRSQNITRIQALG